MHNKEHKHMKNYQKCPMSVYNAAPVHAPVYFPLVTNGDPELGAEVALFYDNNGKYMGYTSAIETVRKYLYGQLYYKANRMYSVCMVNRGGVRSRRRRMWAAAGVVKTVRYRVTVKAGGADALFICIGKIDAEALIDPKNVTSVSELAIEKIVAHQTTSYNFNHYPDQYGLIDKALLEKFEKEMKDMIARQKNEVIEHIRAKATIHTNINSIGDLLFARAKKAQAPAA